VNALESVLRYIYGCETEKYRQKCWQHWLEVAETADRHIEPRLSEDAVGCFEMSALSLQEAGVEEICGILQTLQDTERYGVFQTTMSGFVPKCTTASKSCSRC
jgi:hypothetical protein